MELGEKICQLRKLSGMTQEQLAGKLNIARQTLSKWENGTSMPDVESVVRIAALLHTSLEELLLPQPNTLPPEKGQAQITLEDMMRINAHNRKMNLLLCSSFLFLAIAILLAAVENMLETTTVSLHYILYRYIATGQYAPAPVNYMHLMLPAIFAGLFAIVLLLCYFFAGKEHPINLSAAKRLLQNGKKYFLICSVSVALVMLLPFASGLIHAKKEHPQNPYGNIIASLHDEEQFTLTDIGADNDILFTTDATYDDGNGNNASISCYVYYADNDCLYPLGKIESMGTAYPISYGDKCIYTASTHSLEIYAFDHQKRQWTLARYEEIFDPQGNVSFLYTENGLTETISEQEYLAAMKDYINATVVSFAYGASARMVQEDRLHIASSVIFPL